RRRPARAIAMLVVVAALAGCASRPYGGLIVGTTTPGASKVELMVATTRAPADEPPGVLFGGARCSGFEFADIVVSVPPEPPVRALCVEAPPGAPGGGRHMADLAPGRSEP